MSTSYNLPSRVGTVPTVQLFTDYLAAHEAAGQAQRVVHRARVLQLRAERGGGIGVDLLRCHQPLQRRRHAG